MTRFIEETPTTEVPITSGVLDGNTDYYQYIQFDYLDGNGNPNDIDYTVPEIIRKKSSPNAEPNELTYNFVPSPAYFDGNYHLITNTILLHNSGDGNLNLIDGHAYSEPAPTFEASLSTGDIYQGKYVFKFPEHIQFQDGSYVLFGPTTVKNNTYPIERNILFIEDDFEYTVELGDYVKAGVLDNTVAWPPVVAELTPQHVLIGPPTTLVNSTYVPMTPDLFINSTYDDGTGYVYDNSGAIVAYTKDYSLIVYDPQGTNKLHNDSALVETFDGKTLITQGVTGVIIKGEVVYKGVKYWCKLYYKGKDKYSVTFIGPSTGAINKTLFASKRFNKWQTT